MFGNSRNDATTPTHTLPDTIGAAAVRARIEDFCAEFGCAPPTLRTRNGEIVIEPVLVNWIKREGACWNWIIEGNPMAMARLWRTQRRDVALRAADRAIERECRETGLLLPATVEV
ncbi:MAG: hypothetical protein MUF73_06895 [Rhodobacteraceae bacterium]|nr:hypothetical protein [Paracoccaceae bacterium]